MKFRIAVAVLAILMLCACQTAPTVQEVKIPVAVSCLKEVPAKPEYWFGRGAMPAAAEAVKLLAKDFEAAELYGARWEAAAAGCVALMQQPQISLKTPEE